jgi:hypothetical protein
MLPYARRWAIQGRKPNGDSASTIFDLQHDLRHVRIYPATVDTYAVTVDADAMRMLADTASSGAACAVPADHAVHGRRLLGLRPYPSQLDRPAEAPPHHGPMELYVTLPSAEIRIVHEHPLATILTTIADSMN